MILAILFSHSKVLEASSSTKGSVQISFTGIINSSVTNNLNFKSVQLNVISVRFNAAKPTANVTDATSGWQTIGVPSGTTAGQTNSSVTFGTNFGPNGNTVGIGQGRIEMGLNLSSLQGSVQLFNTGKIPAKTYNWIELVLDPTTPGTVISQCGGASSGEGCITYPLQFASSVSSIILNLAPNSFTVTRHGSTLLALAISVDLGAPPTQSNQTVLINSLSICPLPTFTNSTPASCVSTLTSQGFPGLTAISGEISDTVTGSNNKTMVNAELVGTGTVVSTVPVDTKTHTYDMILPVGNYDIYATSSSGHSIDAHSNVTVPKGQISSPLASPDPFHFTIASKGTAAVSGKLIDNCSGSAIIGANLELFGPPTFSSAGSTCPGTGTTSGCITSCALNPDGSIPSGCMVIATASSTDLGDYPVPGSGSHTEPFNIIPKLDTAGTNQYALMAIGAGYNTELLGVNTNKNGSFECQGSGFNKKSGVIPCNFSMPRGELDVFVQATPAPPTNPLNVLVNVEDSGTFNGENIGMTSIQPGNISNVSALPIYVPASLTPGPASTATPFYVNAPSKGYDVFSSAQDLFGAAPQITSGHTFAVVSGVAAPGQCSTSTLDPLPLMSCVGHGSITGTFQSGYPTQNTLLVTSKDNVDVIVDQVADSTTAQQFAICAPVDNYTLTHDELQPGTFPTASPSPVGTPVPFSLTGPITIPTPCNGICGNTGSTCLLCQPTNATIGPL